MERAPRAHPASGALDEPVNVSVEVRAVRCPQVEAGPYEVASAALAYREPKYCREGFEF
jgi:hypothetical protein